MNYKTISLIAVLMVVCLTQVACTVATIDNVITLSDVVVSTLATVDPGLPGVLQASNYVNAVLNGTDCAVKERASTDSPAAQYPAIVACYASAIKPVLPPGTPQQVANDINALAIGLTNYERSLVTGTVLASTDGASLPTLSAHVDKVKAKSLVMLKRPHAG